MNTTLRLSSAQVLRNFVSSACGLAFVISAGCGTQAGVSGDDADDVAVAPDADSADSGPADTGPADTGPADTGPADVQQPDVQTTDTGPDVAADVAVDVATDATITCSCGDGVCDGACGEDVKKCPADCAGCGDGKCAAGEGPISCPEDCCGQCGDGKCVGYSCGENATTCAKDCGTSCGNGICEKGENPVVCAADCQKQVCGNGVCEPEDGGPKTCPQDCGTTCGNCICEKGEDFTGCPVDCGFCGDGVCSQCAGLAESATTCTADCKANCFAKGCDDGVACTTDLCGSDGNCAHVPNMAACNDNNSCTDDACVPGTGCVQTPNSSSCNDNDACTTNDGCADSKCAGIAKNCDDNNPCSTDSCTPGTGACAHVSTAGPCEDGDACTVGDACSAGKCLPGAVTDCNDQDDCTADTCDTFAGCQHTPVACKACTPDEACAPTNLCHLGTTTCVNKKPVCNDTGDPAPDDTPCGTGKGCVTGTCKSFSNFTSVVTGGGQTGVVDGVVLPVVIKVVDLGNAPVADATVTITAPTGAAAVPSTGKTNGQGKFTFSPRLGRATGDYVYTIKVQLAGPIQVTATAKAADPGLVYTLVNADHSNGNDGKPGPATTAHTSSLGDMTRASDGTLYVADSLNHQILKVTPAGEISVIAGSTQGNSGDNGPAIQAKFSYPGGVALDEANGQLYIADTQNSLIRVVDLASGIISSFGGEGSAPSPGYGDSGPANAAVFAQPVHIFKGPDAGLYVIDSGHNRVRRIDLNTSIVTPWLGTATGGNCNDEVDFSSCGGAQYLPSYIGGSGSCVITWDTAGNAYIGATICGNAPNGTTNGVIKRAPGGTLTYLAGKYGGATGDSGPANQTAFGGIGGIALDPVGNIYVSEPSSQRVRKIEQASGRVTTLLGTGTAGYAGDYATTDQTQVNVPWTLLFDETQNLYFIDSSNCAVREVSVLGQTVATPAVLSLVSGNNQSNTVDQVLPTPFVAKLVDDKGVPLVGYYVSFNVVDLGAGLYATNVKSDANGNAKSVGRPGLAAKSYKIHASYKDLDGKDVSGSPVEFTMTATAPDPGTIFTALNIDHSAANDGKPGSAALAHADALGDIVAASDGTLYIADAHNALVYRMTPAGYLTVVAGSTQGYSGDNGPGPQAKLSWPVGVALDEANQQLYIADANNGVIRAVDLTTGIITTFAGGGGAPGPGYGDSGPASEVVFANPLHIYKGPDAGLYVADSGHNRIRRIDLNTSIVTPWLGSQAGASCGSALEFSNCGGVSFLPNYLGYNAGCAISWDGSGNAYIGATFCGTSLTANINAIVKRAPNGTLSLVAGALSGDTGEGVPATTAALKGTSSLAVDASGKIWLTEANAARIRQIDAAGNISTVAGTGTAGYFGDYVPLVQAVVSQPSSITLLPGGHVAFADAMNYCLRYVW